MVNFFESCLNYQFELDIFLNVFRVKCKLSLERLNYFNAI